MYRRKDGTWCDTIPREGQTPKFFYGKTQSIVKRKMQEYRERKESGILFREAAELWLASQEKKVRDSTYYNYSAPYERILARFGDTPVTKISPCEIQEYINSVAAKGYAKARVQLYLVILRGAFREAINLPESPLAVNPCGSVVIPPSCKNSVRCLPRAEQIRIVRENTTHEFGLFPFLLIYTGLRKGEALALTRDDFKNGFIFVTKALKYNGSSTSVGEPKTKSSIRKVIILKPLAEILPKWDGYLFSPDGGKSPLSSAQFERLWNNYCLDVGLARIQTERRHRKDGREYQTQRVIRDICCHQFRHEFATICFDAGLDSMDTAEMLGHADDEITKAIYTHIKESRRVKSYGKLQDYVCTHY